MKKLYEPLLDAFRNYSREVSEGIFPTTKEGFAMNADELTSLQRMLDQRKS